MIFKFVINSQEKMQILPLKLSLFMITDYLPQIKLQNKRVTAKFMTLIENNDKNAIEQLKSIYLENTFQKAHIIGLTGLPGSGKSTLISQLIKFYRSQHLGVGVIAIDPTSPFTGGALLGDRLRMDEFALDQQVFIRSMASRGRLGGLAPATSAFIKILEYYGCDIILVETVGTGQSETDIMGMADSVVLVTIPGTGDQIQALKAGIFEIADIFVINKADLPGKDKQALFIKQVLELDSEKKNNVWKPPIIESQAVSNDLSINGILALVEELRKHRKLLATSNLQNNKKKSKIKTEILTILQFFIAHDLLHMNNGEILSEAVEKIYRNELDPYTFIQNFLARYGITDKKEK